MSATITPTPTPVIPTTIAANTPKATIIAAQTPADIVKAMADDPAIQSSILNAFTTLLANQSALGSKTIWAAILVPLILSLSAHFGLTIDQATGVEIASAIMGVAMIVMRLVTKGGPVTTVLPAPPPVVKAGS